MKGEARGRVVAATDGGRNRLTDEEKVRCDIIVDLIEMVKRNTVRWFGHVKRMEGENLTKMVYVSEVGKY